jgi:hypothetical protein
MVAKEDRLFNLAIKRIREIESKVFKNLCHNTKGRILTEYI